MHPALTATLWLGLLALVGVGAVGATSVHLPVAGLVVVPALGWAGLRHGRHMPRLLLGALCGNLPVVCWPEAREVVTAARRGGEAGAWIAALVGLTVIPSLPVSVQIAATAQALAPLAVAYGLSVTLGWPLERHLRRGYDAWIAGLHEALSPPAPLRVTAPARQRRSQQQRRRSA